MLPFFPEFVPGLVRVFPFVLAFCLACAPLLRHYAAVFYLVFGAAAFVMSWSNLAMALLGDATPAFVLAYDVALDATVEGSALAKTLAELTASSYAGVSFYLIVMFAGAMRRTPAVKRLLAVRSELSVLGGIVVFGHVLRIFDFPSNFANPMFNYVLGTPGKEFMFVATAVIGPLLTVCFLVPWVTSFKAVRRRMTHATWKKTQLLAYPFMVLMLLQGFFLALGHLFLGYPWDNQMFAQSMLADSAAWLATFAQSVLTAGLYLVLLVTYVAMRLSKRCEDRARKARLVGAANA